ncbi:MAG: metallophosphoesterase [Actinobacteria bacterium]|nr:metallophosphoesterase [Actinomycetota bacterium]
MPANVTVVQISDCHLQRESNSGDGSPDEALRRAIELATAAAPDVVLLTGDIADDASTEAYERVAAAVAVLGVPVLAIPGNHDEPAAVAATFGSVADYEIGGWRLCMVDTTIPATIAGSIDVAALLHRLGPIDGPPTVVVLHHPPITTSTHPWFQLDGAQQLVAALNARGDVRVVVSGHLHEAFNVVLGDVSYIGCSSSWYSLKHRNHEYMLDNGHVGALALSLTGDGTFSWRRLPDPNETSTLL